MANNAIIRRVIELAAKGVFPVNSRRKGLWNISQLIHRGAIEVLYNEKKNGWENNIHVFAYDYAKTLGEGTASHLLVS